MFKFEIVELENGIPVIMEVTKNVKSATIGIYAITGSKYENYEEKGISHLLEHMLFKGTSRRNAKEISEDIDNVGGKINAYTSKEVTAYYVSIVNTYLNLAIDVLADIYTNSTFPEEELEKEKKVVIEEIRMYEDIPEEKIHEINSRFVLNKSNLGLPIAGSEESVTNISRELLKKYWEDRYTKDNTVISVVGNFNKEEVIKQLNENIGKLNRTKVDREYNKEVIINTGIEEMKRESNQVHLCVNTKGISYLDKNRYILSLLSNILGGSMSSRLFQKVREDKGLAYSVYTYSSMYKEGGFFTAYAGSTKDKYNEAIEIIKNEFKDIYENGITKKELEKSKNQYISDLTLGLETTRSRMARMALAYIRYGEIRKIEAILEDIKNITLEDIHDFAKTYFKEDNYSVVALGDI
ncbi:M16 family metallopeptidase [Haliovirga abyssi]|uniref:Zinc protease n=1 Tax=Haliovirga abyssi TaxID=2996794 RepID=A0AAU9DBV1_9FUSO|nr:pitrilysin family protein [Haliovirga abyssi]BDU50770.1 zinc protease [Haliovirga abyssi]